MSKNRGIYSDDDLRMTNRHRICRLIEFFAQREYISEMAALMSTYDALADYPATIEAMLPVWEKYAEHISGAIK